MAADSDFDSWYTPGESKWTCGRCLLEIDDDHYSDITAHVWSHHEEDAKGATEVANTEDKPYTAAQHQQVRGWVKKIARGGYSNEESVVDKLINAGVLDFDRILEIVAEAQAAKDRRAESAHE